MEPYQRDEKSSSLWMPMGSKESEASGVNGDGERDPVAVVDDADIVDAISKSEGKLVCQCPRVQQKDNYLFWKLSAVKFQD